MVHYAQLHSFTRMKLMFLARSPVVLNRTFSRVKRKNESRRTVIYIYIWIIQNSNYVQLKLAQLDEWRFAGWRSHWFSWKEVQLPNRLTVVRSTALHQHPTINVTWVLRRLSFELSLQPRNDIFYFSGVKPAILLSKDFYERVLFGTAWSFDTEKFFQSFSRSMEESSSASFIDFGGLSLPCGSLCVDVHEQIRQKNKNTLSYFNVCNSRKLFSKSKKKQLRQRVRTARVHHYWILFTAHRFTQRFAENLRKRYYI